MGHTALNMEHTATWVRPGKWETDMTLYIPGLMQRMQLTLGTGQSHGWCLLRTVFLTCHLGTLLKSRHWGLPGGWRGSAVDTACGGQVGWSLGLLAL